MAVIVHEDAPARRSAAAPTCALDMTKLLVWIAAATLPWAVLALAARAISAAIG